ncbi:hypothetical protein GCM10027590_24050 [Nocardiopsis nanhaiensis]
MTREALDGDDLDARSGDGHNHAAGKEDTPARKETPDWQSSLTNTPDQRRNINLRENLAV